MDQPDPSRVRWARIRDIFDLAADAPAEQRALIVTHEAAGDAALEHEVMLLLAAYDPHHDNLELDLDDEPIGQDRMGQIVASYRLGRLLGRGGMGTVYEAARHDGQYTQRVAVKFIRAFTGTDGLAGRFRRERQILASLEHRNIARLIDGGTTAAGEPYFVMEYVEGSTITAYADRCRLTLTDRLRLFLQACAAVEHAHGKFVVHRDLKPANILVTDDGSVKLLDFGVAKLLGAQDGDDVITMTRAQPFTPEYASPEQLRDEPASAASDVYSLGVVLYELLSGRRPFEGVARSPVAVLRAAETGPPRPSAVATPAAAAASGERSLVRFKQHLAGELDNVVLKATRSDIAVRYRSVEQLSADVRRYLDGLPVSAQPDRLGYRLRKFVRRHRAPVVAAAVVLITLILGLAVAIAQARRANAEQLWEMAVNAAANVDELGNEAFARGDLHQSDSLLQVAVALCHTSHPGSGVPLICTRSVYDASLTLLWKGDPAGAERLLRPLLTLVHAAAARTPGHVPPVLEIATANVLGALARARDDQGDLAGAERLFRQSSDHLHAGNGDSAPDRIEALGWHAVSLERQGRFAEADSLVRLQLTLASGTDVSIIRLHLGRIEWEEGKADLARRDVALARGHRGPEADVPALYYAFITETEALADLVNGHVDSAVAQLRRTVAVASREYAGDDPRLAEVQDALGQALMVQHHPEEAVPLFAASVATYQRRFGTAHPQTVASERHLAAAQAQASLVPPHRG